MCLGVCIIRIFSDGISSEFESALVFLGMFSAQEKHTSHTHSRLPIRIGGQVGVLSTSVNFDGELPSFIFQIIRGLLLKRMASPLPPQRLDRVRAALPDLESVPRHPGADGAGQGTPADSHTQVSVCIRHRICSVCQRVLEIEGYVCCSSGAWPHRFASSLSGFGASSSSALLSS